MEKLDLTFLSAQQTQGLDSCCENLVKWEKFKKDYEILRDKIESHPSCISYEAMVPFGPKAFMPGKLIHTNEILVLLGENWFAQCSATQAISIINRRLKQCELTIKKLKEEKRLLESWMRVTNEVRNENTVDITEPYDEEREKIWKEKHRQSLKRWREEGKKAEEVEDDLIMKRLDELELNEGLDNELSVSSSVLSMNHASNHDVCLGGGTVSGDQIIFDPDTVLYDSQGTSTNDGDSLVFSEASIDSSLGTIVSACQTSIDGSDLGLPTTPASSTDMERMDSFLGAMTLLPCYAGSKTNPAVTSESDYLTEVSGKLCDESLTESEESLSLGGLAKKTSSAKKHVKWGVDSEYGDNTSGTQIIYFSHTEDNSQSANGNQAKSSDTLTPADLKPKKSILKSTSSDTILVVETTPLPESNPFYRTQTAIAEKVVERGTDESQLSNTSLGTDVVTPRSISKFKANRKNKSR